MKGARFREEATEAVAKDERASGARPKFALEESGLDRGWDEPEEPPPPLDLDLDAAEREGQLLARIAYQDREIARLKKKLDRMQEALAEALEQIAVTAIHDSPTNPPPKQE